MDIVSSARFELDNLQKSTIPRSRMSNGNLGRYAGTESKGKPIAGSKLSMGLPALRPENNYRTQS